MIYKALHRKQLIGQHVYVYPRENEVVFLCEFRYLKRTESETAAERKGIKGNFSQVLSEPNKVATTMNSKSVDRADYKSEGQR